MNIGMPKWLTASVVISISSLAFTILSFWWIQVRRGRLRAYDAPEYAASFRPTTLVSIPIVLYNTGPAPLIAKDFRMTIDAATDECRVQPGHWLPKTLSWHGVQSDIKPTANSHSLPSAVIVNGRSVVKTFLEFQMSLQLLVEQGPYQVTIECRRAHRRWRPWITLLEFDWNTQLVPQFADQPLEQYLAPYIARTNDPDWKIVHNTEVPPVPRAPGDKVPGVTA